MAPDDANPDLPSSSTASSSRPAFQRATTAPWPARAPSSESLPQISHRNPASPPLRKRHSTFAISQHQHPQPDLHSPLPSLPSLPPHRPPRNPARTNTLPSDLPPVPVPSTQPGSRPSTSASTRSRDDFDLQHEFHPAYREERPQVRSGAPSVRSHASSALTGPVEEVTPWELEPVPPIPIPLPSRESMTTSPPSVPPTRAVPTATTTGPIEEVTPWELYPAVIPEKVVDPPAAPRSSYVPPQPATGPTEEVTPWEMYPAPSGDDDKREGSINSTGPRSSLTLSKAQIEDITPWDLFPAPAQSPEKEKSDPVAAAGTVVKKKNSRSSTRPSSSSGTSKTLSELGFVRRRRSTDSKSVKSRSGAHASTMTSKSPVSSSSTFNKNRSPSLQSQPSETSPRVSPTTPRFGLNAGAVSPLPTPVPTPTTSGNKYTSPGSSSSPEQRVNQDRKFSTADRTILEELKRNISARAAHFVIKGKGNKLLGGDISPGKKYHAYPREQVPYPRSYEREVVDLDVWETMFCQDLCGSFTFHDFEKPPMRVLDIGCGSGSWILNCARIWKECQFVGLDIVPIQPDLQQAGSPDLASRITWIQANFLDNLPFPNEEFDFVHIKRIALGVPENNWTTLFAEIERVMKPGGAIEVIEEDLFFPGHIADNDDDSNVESDAETTMSHISMATSNGRYTSEAQENGSILEEPEKSEDDDSPITPTKSAISSEFPPVPTHIPQSDHSVSFHESLEMPDNALVVAPESPPSVSPKGSPYSRYMSLITPHSRSAARPLLQVKTTPTLYPRQISQKIAGSTVSLMSSMGYAPMDSSGYPPNTKTRRRSSSIVTPSTDPPSASTENSFGMYSSEVSSLAPPPITPDTSHNVDRSSLGQRSSKPSPHMTPEKPPVNPRDHTIIETIYKEMLASRFINSSPISVLGTYLEFYFRDVRTHPPILYAFPPARGGKLAGEANVDQMDYDSDDARDAIIPSARKPSETLPGSMKSSRRGSTTDGTEEQRFVTMEDLVNHSSRYVLLDESRGVAFAPKLSGPRRISREKIGHVSRLPNTRFHINLKTLHLHLALRAKEILACSESMWEWVSEHQAQMRSWQPGRSRAAAAGSPPSRAGLVPTESHSDAADISIDTMTRDDFNHLLANFDMDMQDQIALGRVLENEFAWKTIVSEYPERKTFDKACEKWDAWALKNIERQSSDSYHVVSAVEESSSSQNNMSRRSSREPVSISSSQGRNSTTSKPSFPSSLHSSAYPASQRLARAMRVFVGWKAEDT